MNFSGATIGLSKRWVGRFNLESFVTVTITNSTMTSLRFATAVHITVLWPMAKPTRPNALHLRGSWDTTSARGGIYDLGTVTGLVAASHAHQTCKNGSVRRFFVQTNAWDCLYHRHRRRMLWSKLSLSPLPAVRPGLFPRNRFGPCSGRRLLCGA